MAKKKESQRPKDEDGQTTSKDNELKRLVEAAVNEALGRHTAGKKSSTEPSMMKNSTVSEALKDPEERKRLELPDNDHDPGAMVVELNLLHAKGLTGAERRFHGLYEEHVAGWQTRKPLRVANTYYRCDLSMNEVRALIHADQDRGTSKERAIYRVWPDFPIKPLMDRSVATVKADAALRAYNASGTDISWAIIDSGIDAKHPHFKLYDNLGGDIGELHRDFTLPAEASDEQHLQSARTDTFGHGTHVAGIIGGGLPDRQRDEKLRIYVGQRVAVSEDSDLEKVEERLVTDPERLAGIAPRCKLVSLKILNDRGKSRSTDVIRALQYIREEVNGNGKLLRIHGVNVSLGYEFNAKWFACGQSPICVEVDKLVKSGVVVVIAAGNTGYGVLTSKEGLTSTALSLTINDPGNAELAITVGSTHRDMPHTYGISYFSSKGPTGDGRFKPDLVAPGERITSCVAGRQFQLMQGVWQFDPKSGDAAYIDDSGTSMAAPHVSGVIAAFLSIRREFIGRPEKVKEVFLQNATTLGRERYFEGRGLVDLMRTIQAI